MTGRYKDETFFSLYLSSYFKVFALKSTENESIYRIKEESFFSYLYHLSCINSLI